MSVLSPLRRSDYTASCATFTRDMTPTKLRERLAESADSVDVEQFVAALEYVRDDGRSKDR